jgi:nitrogenase-associated protein
MAVVTFYEKPGCAGNAEQKRLLQSAGHTVVPMSLREVPWTRERLLSFLGTLPVADWFNRNSPAVKSGEIVPEACDREAALTLLQKHPLLIRRPLLEANGERRVGFDAAVVDAWIGLAGVTIEGNPEACRHDAGHHCRSHDEEGGQGHGHCGADA